MGQQILLFRIELDPNLKGVFQHFLKPSNPFLLDQNNSAVNKRFVCESERETDKAEGFADDTSALALLSQSNLLWLKNVLVQFSTFSGLRCNFDKSFVIPVGNTENISNLDVCEF